MRHVEKMLIDSLEMESQIFCTSQNKILLKTIVLIVFTTILFQSWNQLNDNKKKSLIFFEQFTDNETNLRWN